MLPGEIALVIFVVLFLVAAFVVIYLVIARHILEPETPGSPPSPPSPTGGGTGATGPCNAGMLNDNNNCCLTGIVCDTSNLQFCVQGSCQCVTGSTLCPVAGFGGVPACVFLDTSIQNCGECGNVCGGGTTCCNGRCVDILSTSQTGTCGGCGPQNVCTGANPTCCNGFCKDLGNDVFNCGGCLQACAQGQRCCGSCVGPDDPSNCGGCGNVCGANHICVNEECVPGCPSGFISCSGQCLDPLFDNFNCGFCTNVCPNGMFCQQGTCSPNVCVNSGEIFCPDAGGCTNVQANKDFCGDCSVKCAHGACVNGLCQCTTNFDCAGGYTCVQSTVTIQQLVTGSSAPVTVTTPGPAFCQPPPCFTPGQVYCASGEGCTDLDIDPNNCSQCGLTCRSGTCTNGACTCTDVSDCPLGYDCLSGSCVKH